MHSHKGNYIVIDGIDRVGKGTLINTIVEHEMAKGRTVFDADQYQALHKKLPSVEDFKGYDMILVSEPTYCGKGEHIRNVLIKTGSTASVKEIASAYSEDRHILLDNIILVALQLGIDVLSSRSVCSSIAYQPLDAELRGILFSVEPVMALPGNRYALQNSPNLLIIPVITSAAAALERSQDRGKDDDCKFEEESFLEKNLGIYKSDWLREIFESKGTKVEYVDTSGTLDDSRRNVLEVWGRHIS